MSEKIPTAIGAKCQQCGAEAPSSMILGRVLRSRLCPACQKREDDHEAETARRRAAIEMRERSNLPPAADGWTAERAEKHGRSGFWSAKCWQWGPQGLYLWGPVGTGKTLTTWIILQDQIGQGRSGLFLHVPAFLADLRHQNRQGQLWEEEARRVKVLVLDDIGSERPTDWVLEVLQVIINHRVDWRLPTIYTSNHSLADLFERLGDRRIVDRIGGSCKGIMFDGESLRMQARQVHG